MACTSVAMCGTDCTPSIKVSAPALLARAHTDATSLIVPSRLLAPPMQTSRVRSVNNSSRRSRSNSNVSVSKDSHFTSRSRSRAISTHGHTLASWSMRERMISSPRLNSRPIDRDRCSVSVVMFWPKTISSGDSAFRKSAIAARARSMISSAACEVTKRPPALALVSSRQREIASATICGTWVPAGLSK